MRDQVTLNLHAGHYLGERERLQIGSLRTWMFANFGLLHKPSEPGETYYDDADRRCGQPRPPEQPSATSRAVDLPQDRREGQLLEVPGRTRVLIDPVGSGAREGRDHGFQLPHLRLADGAAI